MHKMYVYIWVWDKSVLGPGIGWIEEVDYNVKFSFQGVDTFKKAFKYL